MRVQPLTICEKNVIVESLKEGNRLDFRKCNEFRETKLVVGSECGTAMCSVGQTKVLCTVTAQIAEPSSMKPNKGVIHIDVDMSPMANLSHEHDRLGAKGMEITRLLELIIRDSRCVDVESLCIRAGKEVWKLRVDVRILDDDGSLLDCACLAVIAALHHFRRPNVTLKPNHTIVHSEHEKAPIPLNIYHIPICTTIGFLDKGSTIIIDPTEREANCLDGSLVVACNKRREVCALHQSTNLILTTTQIEKCVHIAMKRAEHLSTVINDVIKKDQKTRSLYQHPSEFAKTLPRTILHRDVLPTFVMRNPVTDVKVEVEEEKPSIQPSMIINENPLKQDSTGTSEMDEEDQIEAQIANIQQSVVDVDMKDQTTNRKREVEEVDDLLAGLDEEEEEEAQTMTLNEVNQDEDEDEDEDCLLKAKKKKRV